MLISIPHYNSSSSPITLSVPESTKAVPTKHGVSTYYLVMACFNASFTMFNLVMIVFGIPDTILLNAIALLVNLAAAYFNLWLSNIRQHMKVRKLMQQPNVLDLSRDSETRKLITAIPGFNENPHWYLYDSDRTEAERTIRAVLLDPIARSACELLVSNGASKLIDTAKQDLQAEIYRAADSARSPERDINEVAFGITGKDPYRPTLEEK